jgi:hypothetical protein
MKVVRFPEGLPAEDLEFLAKKSKEEYPNEHILFISDAIDIHDLSLKDLSELRDMIDKEISDREIMIPGERNKL